MGISIYPSSHFSCHHTKAFLLKGHQVVALTLSENFEGCSRKRYSVVISSVSCTTFLAVCTRFPRLGPSNECQYNPLSDDVLFVFVVCSSFTFEPKKFATIYTSKPTKLPVLKSIVSFYQMSWMKLLKSDLRKSQLSN